MKKITIDPVTRIEGHAKITISINDNNKVGEAKIHVTQYRGFEKFCEGRLYTEMPQLTARTCGICPVSHSIASTKASDEILSVKPPKTGEDLRQVINLAQMIQSHALNFFHLSSPDLVYGFDAKKEDRNIFKMMQTHPEMAKDGIELRAFGQKIIEQLGGKRIHPSWIVAGGVSHKLEKDIRDTILNSIPRAFEIAKKYRDYFLKSLHRFDIEIKSFANFESLFMAISNESRTLDFYDGKLTFIDSNGDILKDNIEIKDYKKYIGEAVESDSYLKSPYYLPYGYEKGLYRVGALSRLNIANSCGTYEADKELERFKNLNSGKPVLNSFYYHYARIIEIIHSIEKIEQILNQDDILSDSVRAKAYVNRTKGVGCSEAPRGTLIHDYEVNKDGVIQKVNLIIATGNNNLAMNKGITQVAKEFIDTKNITDGALNRVEATIRCFDPCLSCSTHSLGIVSSNIDIVDSNGNLLDSISRN
jgi:NAD-reducing hydrogenase large subunit